MNTPVIEHYRVEALAKRLDVSQATIWRWVKRGECPPLHRIGPGSTRGLSREWDPYLSDPAGWRAVHRPKAPEALAA